MPDTTISALTDGTTASGTDDIPAARSGANVRITPAYIKTYMFTSGTITTSQPLSFTQTWNAGGVTFQGFIINITNTASAAESELFRAGVAGVASVTIRKDGAIGSDASFSGGMCFSSNIGVTSFGRYATAATVPIVCIGDDGGGAPGVRTHSTGFYSWANSSAANPAADTGLYRNAAGVVEVNNGTAGTFRDILARAFRNTALTFATLPTGVAGMTAYITDCNTATWGATAAAGGANKVLVFYNGTNWTVCGA